MNLLNTAPRHRFIAYLVAGWSVGWFQFFRGFEPSNLLATAIAGAMGLYGLSAAIKLWQGIPSAKTVYGRWAVVHLVGVIVAEAMVEPVLWKVAAGFIMCALVLGMPGYYLSRVGNGTGFARSSSAQDA